MLLRFIRTLRNFITNRQSDWWHNKIHRIYRLKHRSLDLGHRIRFNVPVRCDGTGSVLIGNSVSFGYLQAPRYGSGEILIQARLPNSRIEILENSSFSNNVAIIASSSVIIGKNCLIGDQVSIFDSDFHEINPQDRKTESGASDPVLIGKNVWIGTRAIILKGVSIGDNCVVAAGSVVVKSMPNDVIVGGNPARVIGSVT